MGCSSNSPLYFKDKKDTNSENALSESSKATIEKMALSDRTYVYNKLYNLFALDAEPTMQERVRKILEKNIQAFPQIFGGPCSEFDEHGLAGCQEDLSNQDAAMTPTSFAARQALIITTCEKILDSDDSVEFVSAKFGSGILDSEKIFKLYGLFYPEQELDPELLQNLRQISKLADPSESSNASWRYVLLTLCQSPEWQIF